MIDPRYNLLLSGLTAATLLIGTQSIVAQPAPAGMFDKPVAVRKAAPQSKDASNEIRCTYYADFMVREITDGPTSEDAAIVRGANPPCNARKVAGEITLKTEGMALDGRKGQMLFFSQMDAHGAVNFAVVDAKGGRSVFNDAAVPSSQMYQAIAVDAGGIRLRYERGINAPCSLVQDAAGCLAKLTKEGQLGPVAPGQVPSPQICSAAYKSASAPPDAPSILSYLNEVLIEATGTIKVVSRGPFRCGVQP